MGIDISIHGVSRQDWLANRIYDAKEVTEGDDWMSLKNCLFLEELLTCNSRADREVVDHYHRSIVSSLCDVSKPFAVKDMEDAVRRLKGLDEAVAKMPFHPDGQQWMNDDNKAIVSLVETVFKDNYRLFIFPWTAKERGWKMGSHLLQDILKRAIANARRMPPDTVLFLEMS